jgi:carboxypeptidase D
MVFLDELMADASQHGVSVILYSGNDDSLISHFGTQVVIQNTTFGGVQGFTKEPGTPWTDDEGNLAGVIHQERNLTYALFLNAGHQVPFYAPKNVCAVF